MAKRRGKNEGSIYKRSSDGRWVAKVTVAGRSRSRFAPTREAAARALLELQRDAADGLPAVDRRTTVGSFLTFWLETARPGLRESSYRRYESYCRVHAIPELGKVKLAALGPAHLQAFYASREAAGVGKRTVGHLHRVLHRAFSQAMRWNYIVRNPCELVDPPRVERHEITRLTIEQARRLIAAAEGDRFAALYIVALATGARQGELFALTWGDVDLDTGRITITATVTTVDDSLGRAEPKTPRSRRQVELDAMAVAALRHHRREQNEERLRLGALWEDNDLVFPNYTGRLMRGQNLGRSHWKPLLRRAGLPVSTRFHDLRHSAATIMLAQGVPLFDVSRMLGHAGIAITADTYGHTDRAAQRRAAETLGAVLDGRA